MRLTPEQQEIIRQATREAYGPQARVWLFGSRVDDAKRGGDIDLLIDPHHSSPSLSNKFLFLGLLERRLVERKVDVVVALPDDPRPIIRVARQTGVA